jgi:hypothetical protein
MNNFSNFIVCLNGTKLYLSENTLGYYLFSTWNKQIIRYKKQVFYQKSQFLIRFFQIKFWSSEEGYIQDPKRHYNSIVYSFSSDPEGEWKNCQRVLKFLPLIFGSEMSKQVKWVRNVRVDYSFFMILAVHVIIFWYRIQSISLLKMVWNFSKKIK